MTGVPTSKVTTNTVGWDNSTSALTGTCVFLTHGIGTNNIYDASKYRQVVNIGRSLISGTGTNSGVRQGVVTSEIIPNKYGGGPYNNSIGFALTNRVEVAIPPRSQFNIYGSPSASPSDYLVIPSSLSITLGTGDFTIELWVYVTALPTSGFDGIISQGYGTTLNTGWSLEVNPSGYIVFKDGNRAVFTTSVAYLSVSPPLWHHICVQRSNNSISAWADGRVIASNISITTDFNDQGVGSTDLIVGGVRRTGAFGVPSIASTLNGYIEDLRITKGIARYTPGSALTLPNKNYPAIQA
jgi:hypothetical protein